MAFDLFTTVCPGCGTDLGHDCSDETTCSSCQRTFRWRFGHLIPVGEGTPASPTGR